MGGKYRTWFISLEMHLFSMGNSGLVMNSFNGEVQKQIRSRMSKGYNLYLVTSLLNVTWLGDLHYFHKGSYMRISCIDDTREMILYPFLARKSTVYWHNWLVRGNSSCVNQTKVISKSTECDQPWSIIASQFWHILFRQFRGSVNVILIHE